MQQSEQTPPTPAGQGFSDAPKIRRLILIATLIVSACSLAQPAQAPTPGPITATGDDGMTVSLAAPPQKVISLTPATSELMFALGAGDRLVGRTDYDDYPAQVTQVPAVASFTGVQMEKVVDIGPDLVLAGGNGFTPQADIDRMRELGFPVLVLYASDVDGVLADIRLVGQAIEEGPAADGVVGDIQARIDEVSRGVEGLDTPSVFYEIGNEPEIYGPAPNSFVADMVALAGGDPLTTTDPAIFSISLERLVSLDPEVIVLGDAAYGVCPGNVVTRPGWAGISAVADGHVRPVDDLIVTRPGPRLGEGLAALALAIHPDADIAPPVGAAPLCANEAAP